MYEAICYKSMGNKFPITTYTTKYKRPLLYLCHNNFVCVSVLLLFYFITIICFCFLSSVSILSSHFTHIFNTIHEERILSFFSASLFASIVIIIPYFDEEIMISNYYQHYYYLPRVLLYTGVLVVDNNSR